MPLHRFYVPPDLYSADDKAKIAEAITEIYTKKLQPLPAFYVAVIFIDVKEEDYFVGGKKTQQFVRVVVDHLARQFSRHSDPKPYKAKFMGFYEEAIKPFTKDRGLDWEVAISEGDADLWRANGLIPPHATKDEEAQDLWLKENKPVPY